MTDLAALDAAESRQEAMKGTLEEWATESLLAARQAFQVLETGKRIKPGQKLVDSYQVANFPVVRRRIYQGGVRLAMVLNEAFSEKQQNPIAEFIHSTSCEESLWDWDRLRTSAFTETAVDTSQLTVT